jgi:glycerophosphoryl diester phosphodiesterase
MDALFARPVAHRGLHGRGLPENSLAAVAAAVELGLPVEIDVRVSADGVAVVHHDVDLRRLCGIGERVRDLPARELTTLRLAGTGHPIPTLAEVLDLVGTHVPVLVDCKVVPTGRERARMLGAVLRDVRPHRGRVAVVGFDPWLFARLREEAPQVLRGQSAGVSAHESPFPRAVSRAATPLDRFWLNGISQPHFLTYNLDRLPQPALARLRDSGLPVLGWTARHHADLAAVRGAVDNVIAEGEAMDRLLGGPVLAAG